MKRPLIQILFLVVLLAACENNPVIPNETQTVIQAYLYAGGNVDQVYVYESASIGSTDSAGIPISNASAYVYQNGAQFKLHPDAKVAGKYTYEGTGLSITPGKTYQLVVDANGRTSTAECTVPNPPVGVQTSQSTMTYKKESISTPFGSMTFWTSDDSLKIEWANPSNDYHYVLVESIDPNRTLVQSDTLRRFRFVTQPTQDSYYRIVAFSVNYTGRYRALVYRVNKEYVDLYRSREQDSRSLNEPLTNIKNGLGIFTAFASDSVFFEVKVE
jgi:hypothetical protein